MGLNGQCPVCGVRGHLAIFLVVMESKQAMAIIAELPREVSSISLYYLDLFRPASGQAIGMNKAMRLLSDLRDEIKCGYVQPKGKIARPCPAWIWAEAIQTMLDQRACLDLPMPNHTYLKKVAWGKADEADKNQEAAGRNKEGTQTHHGQKSVPNAWDAALNEHNLLPTSDLLKDV